MSSSSSSSVSSAALQFREDGFVVLRRVLPSEVAQGGAGVAVRALTRCLSEVARRTGEATMRAGQRGGYREIVRRHSGRYEMRYGLDEVEEVRAALLKGLPLLVAKQVLGDDAVVMSTSFIVADKNCEAQAWHVDGAHASLTRHEPCHCLNVFFPLVDTHASGTELRPGSHFLTRDIKRQFLVAKAKKQLRPPVVPNLSLGDCLLFDYRVLHRGLRNTTGHPRPILVLTVAKPWFKDILNFPTRSIYDLDPKERDPLEDDGRRNNTGGDDTRHPFQEDQDDDQHLTSRQRRRREERHAQQQPADEEPIISRMSVSDD